MVKIFSVWILLEPFDLYFRLSFLWRNVVINGVSAFENPPPLFLIWLILDFLLHVFKSTYRWNCCFCYLFIYFCCRFNVYQNIMDYLDNKLLVWSFENDFPLHFYFFIKSFLKESEETTNILKIHKFFDLCIKETKR